MRVVWVVAVAACGRIGFQPTSDGAALDDSGTNACIADLQGKGAQTCVVRASDSTLLCKGANARGDVGDGTLTERMTLVPILDNVARVGTGEAHTCAIRRDAGLACWGLNDDGQVGNNTRTPVMQPTTIALTDVLEVAPGQTHTCARTATGAVYCWGANAAGQLGDNTTGLRVAPVLTQGVSNASKIVVGDISSCALVGTTVWCWGDGGQDGDPDGADNLVPAAVSLPRPAIDVEAGCHRHVCALLDDGTVWCWGENMAAEVGDGTMTFKQLPTRAGSLSGAREIGVGAFHTCARVDGGDVYCWGRDIEGQVTGTPGPGSVTTPTRVSFVSNVDELAVGCRHTCVRSGTTITCWGWYEGSMLGAQPAAVLAVPGC